MSSFDERERAFESQFAHDQELTFKVIAHGNKLLGDWLASEMGLKGADAANYANELVEFDLEEKGHDHLVVRILDDLEKCDVEISEYAIRKQMELFYQDARKELNAE